MMVRIGVAGVGGMGRAHCQWLKRVDGCDFVGVVDVSEEAAHSAAVDFEVRAFERLEQLLEAVDGVVVATPPRTHREVVEACAAAGVHLFVEKPMARTLEDCDAMIAACQEAEVQLMVGQVLRFYPVHALGKRLVAEGEIGDLVYLETDYTGPYRAPRRRPDNWYGTIGGLLENGIHKADLINWFGGRAQTVAAELGSLSGHDDWEDYAVTLLRYREGPVGILRWGSVMGARGTTDTVLDGSGGSLRLDMGRDVAYLRRLGDPEWREIVPDRDAPHGVAGELTHFVEVIREGQPPLVDGRAGRHAVEVVLASYRSAREGAKVALPLSEAG